jgi:hypothetical protein
MKRLARCVKQVDRDLLRRLASQQAVLPSEAPSGAGARAFQRRWPILESVDHGSGLRSSMSLRQPPNRSSGMRLLMPVQTPPLRRAADRSAQLPPWTTPCQARGQLSRKSGNSGADTAADSAYRRTDGHATWARAARCLAGGPVAGADLRQRQDRRRPSLLYPSSGATAPRHVAAGRRMEHDEGGAGCAAEWRIATAPRQKQKLGFCRLALSPRTSTGRLEHALSTQADARFVQGER